MTHDLQLAPRLEKRMAEDVYIMLRHEAAGRTVPEH